MEIWAQVCWISGWQLANGRPSEPIGPTTTVRVSTPPNVKTCCAHSGTPAPGHAAGAAAEILGQTQYQPLTGSVEVAGATPGGVAVWKGTEVQGAGRSWGCLAFLRCSASVLLPARSLSGASADGHHAGRGFRGVGARAADIQCGHQSMIRERCSGFDGFERLT